MRISPAAVATAPLGIPDLGNIAVTPNGQDVVAASWSGTQSGRFRMSDLTPTASTRPAWQTPSWPSHPTAPSPDATAPASST
ncbi:hypothetical protein GXW82_23900 [Streptacidiphilus sp. 4-A2]|nr:hypothetical protein [Streptacidiphilus sp. 4-A2]